MLNKLKSRLILGGAMAAAIACAATVASAATVSGNVAGWVKNATLVGAAPANTSVEIAVFMGLHDSAALKQFAAEVSNPKSATYGRYLTKEQFAQRYAPAAADVTAVKALLEQAGMTNLVVGPHGVYVSATATVSQLRSTFKVTQNLYSYKGLTLRANREEPTVPTALANKIIYIEGLDDTTALRTPFTRSVMHGALVAPASAPKSSAAAPPVTPPPVSRQQSLAVLQ